MNPSPSQIIDTGELNVVGRLVDASNATLFAKATLTLDAEIEVVYKPIAGERPLWDFPHGNLAQREVAAFKISQWGKFNCVPYTTLREGPFGLGAVQEWITSDDSIDIIELAQSQDERIRNLALFDVVVNNTDRKFGHILLNREGMILGCDHGVTFHQDFKLRTVIWQFAGKSLTSLELAQLHEVKNEIAKVHNEEIGQLLHSDEVDALVKRIDSLIENREFPLPSEDWPAVPWPPV
ncbi:MAG: phosphatidylinositol kinase [Actinobacteria bacterium]|nr:phosphatidylinositol kinase [Actinomycetota bacterium]